ncbi:MAG: hypothetical protein WDN01_04430 [Rhizomicrobium sp.]
MNRLGLDRLRDHSHMAKSRPGGLYTLRLWFMAVPALRLALAAL